MVELLLVALLSLGQGEHCTGADFSYGCVEGGLRDDGADLLGTLEGHDDTTIEFDGGDEPDDTISYCGRRTDELCDFEFTITPPPGGAVSMSDLAHFVAIPGTIATEPSGWAVLGLPLNAISTATTHTVDGTLLGRPATVRFTPVAWHWDYGDGATSTTVTGGATWADLGVAEFEPTPTSHVYSTRGARTVSLTIEFRADYRLDGGAWTPIAGTLRLPAAAPVTLRTVGARTALVAHDCRSDPRGPGC